MRERDSDLRGRETKNDLRKRRRLEKRSRKDLKSDGERKKLANDVLDRVEPILADQSGPVALADFQELQWKMRRERLEDVEIHVSHEVVPALEEMGSADASLLAYRTKHEIDREPNLDINRKSVAYWLGSVFLTDTVATSYYYGQSSANIFEGVMPALYPACWTLLMAASGVMFARTALFSSPATSWKHRAPAWIGSCTALVLGVGGLLAFAHYRDRREVGDVTAVDSFVHQMFRDPFGFSDASWMLLLFSFGAALIAIYKLWTADDSIPGFGKLGRAALEAREEATQAMNNAETLIKTVFDNSGNQAERTIHSQRMELQDSVALMRAKLKELGIREPECFGSDDETPAEILDLVERYLEVVTWLQANQALHEVRIGLSRRPGYDGDEDPPAEEVENLTDAVSTAEGWDWLGRMAEKFGFRRRRVDGEEDFYAEE